MSEQPEHRVDKDFVANDESKRVNDPERAEKVARASDWSHTRAALSRKAYNALKDLGMDSDDETTPWKLYSGASHLERDAEQQEADAELAFEEEQLIANMPIEELRTRFEQLQQEHSEVEEQRQEISKILEAQWDRDSVKLSNIEKDELDLKWGKLSIKVIPLRIKIRVDEARLLELEAIEKRPTAI